MRHACLSKRENRTGIELEENQRQAKEGHLYSFTHFRLVAGVRIVFAVNMALPLPASGLLSLGGEKRFGRLDQMPGVDLPKGRGKPLFGPVARACQRRKLSYAFRRGQNILPRRLGSGQTIPQTHARLLPRR
jgi:hypothetical protein